MLAISLAAACGRVAFEPVVDSATQDSAADSPTDGPSSACGATHAFCDDFDRVELLGPWTSATAGLGTLELDPANGYTSPPSLRLTLPDQGDGMGHSLFAMLGTSTTQTRLRIAIQFEQRDAREVDLLRLHWEPPPAPCTMFGLYLVKSTADVIALQETYDPSCGGLTYHPLGEIDAAWHEYEVVVDHSASTILVTRDAVQVLSVNARRPLPPSALSVRLGAPAVLGPLTTSWEFRFDDVVVDQN